MFAGERRTSRSNSTDSYMVNTMPDAGVLATILLIVGLFLLALELMIPSFGMIGILSAISLLVSAWCAWQAWWGTSPGFFWTYLAFWVLGIPSVLGGMLYLIQNSRLGDNIVLKGPGTAQQAVPGCEGVADLVGLFGKAASSLMPGGMVSVNNERFHAESLGVMIDAGTEVEIIGSKGNRLVVRPATSSQIAANVAAKPSAQRNESDALAATEVGANTGDDETGLMDFDIPDS